MTLDDIKIDINFENAIPPLLPEEKEQLSENLIKMGKAYTPLLVWGNRLIDGHNRYYQLKKHPEIEYTIEQVEFEDDEDALAWICRNQYGRRNLNANQMAMLRATAYRAVAQKQGGDRKSNESAIPQNETAAQKTADDFGVSHATISRDVEMLEGVETAEKISPGFKEKFMSGEIKANKQLVSDINKVPTENQAEVVSAVENINSQNTNQENREAQTHAKKLIGRYTEEEIQKAQDSLEGFRDDPFDIESNTDKNNFDNIPVIHNDNEFDSEGRLSPNTFGKVLSDIFTNLNETLNKQYDANKKTLQVEEARERAVQEIQNGIEILNKQIEKFSVEPAIKEESKDDD